LIVTLLASYGTDVPCSVNSHDCGRAKFEVGQYTT
jgi:hypothetical protein